MTDKFGTIILTNFLSSFFILFILKPEGLKNDFVLWSYLLMNLILVFFVFKPGKKINKQAWRYDAPSKDLNLLFQPSQGFPFRSRYLCCLWQLP